VKYSIRKKLTISGLIMLSLIILMVAGSQIIVGFFKNTTEELIVEYHELHAVQEFKMSLSNLLIFASNLNSNDNTISEVEYKKLVQESITKLDTCKKVLTISHKLSLLDEFETLMTSLENSVDQMFHSNETERSELNLLIINIIADGTRKVDLLVNEAKAEIQEYENRTRTGILHGTFTVLTFGIILILILFIGGTSFIRNLTNPIKELVTVTQRIGKGDRKAKVNVFSNDEFLTLADSFNDMVDTLDITTVSKNYLNNILENMFDPLVVTDKNSLIRSVNSAALNLLGYKEPEVVNQHISILFDSTSPFVSEVDEKANGLEHYQQTINKQNYLITKNGKKIPALLTCTQLKSQKNEAEGLIVVGHDLTEKMAYEKELEHVRKEHLIAINEAQEEERIRIATDLHDGLGQSLSAISFSLQNLNAKDNSDTIAVGKIQEQINSTIREAKNLAHNLIPIVLKDFGLIVAIENLINKANELHEIKFTFNSYDFNDRIDPKLEKALYRICQESLNNIVKHAKAKNANY